MSSHIEYQGQDLGRLHLGRKDSEGHYKWTLVMENMGALETLLRLSSQDELIVDGQPEPYERFRKEILEKTGAIYTSLEDYVSSEFPFPFGRRVPEQIAKEAGL